MKRYRTSTFPGHDRSLAHVLGDVTFWTSHDRQPSGTQSLPCPQRPFWLRWLSVRAPQIDLPLQAPASFNSFAAPADSEEAAGDDETPFTLIKFVRIHSHACKRPCPGPSCLLGFAILGLRCLVYGEILIAVYCPHVNYSAQCPLRVAPYGSNCEPCCTNAGSSQCAPSVACSFR